MQIDFYYDEDCPSHGAALARLRDVMQTVGVEAEIRVTKVQTDAEAEQHQFIGSPTIRINGQDIDPPPQDTPYMLGCRAYRRADGRITPLPSADLIRDALQRALA